MPKATYGHMFIAVSSANNRKLKDNEKNIGNIREILMALVRWLGNPSSMEVSAYSLSKASAFCVWCLKIISIFMQNRTQKSANAIRKTIRGTPPKENSFPFITAKEPANTIEKMFVNHRRSFSTWRACSQCCSKADLISANLSSDIFIFIPVVANNNWIADCNVLKSYT